MAAIDFLFGIWVGSVVMLLIAIRVLVDFQERVFGKR